MNDAEGKSVDRHDVPAGRSATATHDSSRQAQVKSAGRVLDILVGLAETPEGCNFSDLARRHNLPKSSLHGLMAVLTDRGFVEFDPQRRIYSLGVRSWEIGQAYLRQRDLVRVALPVMEAVVREINETVQLATLDGIDNVYLAKVDCSHPIRLQSEVGKRLFAHATGLGKVLLADLPEAELCARFRGFSFPSFTSHTLANLPDLLRVLSRVQEQGFAVDEQEYSLGLRCVAVPIVDVDGRVVAALSASIPLMRAEAGKYEAALRSIARASIEISSRLGRSSPDPRVLALTTWQGDVVQPHDRDATQTDP